MSEACYRVAAEVDGEGVEVTVIAASKSEAIEKAHRKIVKTVKGEIKFKSCLTRSWKSDKAYVKRAAHCPVCDSDDVVGEGVEIDGNDATQKVSCHNCNAVWLDIYKLTGYMKVSEPESDKET